MGQVIFTGGDGQSGQTGLAIVQALNSNFTELYAARHGQLHSMASGADHSAAVDSDKGKFVHSNASSGLIEFVNIAEDDIPATIARQADLETHTGDFNNPHQVTAEQLGLGVVGFTAGIALEMTQQLVLNLKIADYGGLGLVDGQNQLTIDFDHFHFGEGYDLDSTHLMPFGIPDSQDIYKMTVSQFLEYMFENGPSVRRYIALNTGGTNVEVLGNHNGITAAIANGNELTFTIPASPAGCRIISARVRFTGYTTLVVKMGTVDMVNGAFDTRWIPIVQAWREDTGAQLTGMTVSMNISTHSEFTINGLINSTYNHIRLSF